MIHGGRFEREQLRDITQVFRPAYKVVILNYADPHTQVDNLGQASILNPGLLRNDISSNHLLSTRVFVGQVLDGELDYEDANNGRVMVLSEVSSGLQRIL